MRCHTCEIDDYKETEQDRDEPMGDGEVERIVATLLDCPTCHAQGLRIPANLLKRHATTLCLRRERLTPANIAWLRKRMRWTQEQMGQRLGGAAHNTVYRWEADRIAMPVAAEYLLRMLVAARFNVPAEQVPKNLADVRQKGAQDDNA